MVQSVITHAALMTIHKKILEWQAAHPNTTWDRLGRRLADRSCNFVLAAEKR
jgi:hypothetical protein